MDCLSGLLQLPGQLRLTGGKVFSFQTEQRIAAFGGYDAWRKAIRPMLPGVRFFDREAKPDINRTKFSQITPSLPRRHFLAGTENLLRWMIFESLLGTLMRLHKSPARPANLHAGGIFAIFSVCGQFVHYQVTDPVVKVADGAVHRQSPTRMFLPCGDVYGVDTVSNEIYSVDIGNCVGGEAVSYKIRPLLAVPHISVRWNIQNIGLEYFLSGPY